MKNRKVFIYISCLLLLLLVNSLVQFAEEVAKTKAKVFVFDINGMISKASVRITQKAFEEAVIYKADYIIIHMNTYGGMVDAADSIRTRILNSKIPVYVFIDNNAASAGALISIACDSIYMREGANIGAATVVDQSGNVVPDKFQSYMRSTMRSTAQAHGKDTIITGKDTLIQWKRDPQIAEAMVDPRTYIPGINDSGKVLTFTTEEAIKNGYCEGKAETITEVLAEAGIKDYEVKQYELSAIETIIGFLLNPMLQGLLIMLIIGGIYFELQSPGIGFPLIAAAAAALLYFAPLYLEGLAEHWELLIFVAGLILIVVELFVIPGFGVLGISGIVLVIGGLTLSMVDNIVFEADPKNALNVLGKALFVVVVSSGLAFVLSIWGSYKIFGSRSKMFAGLALTASQDRGQGYVSVNEELQKNQVGKTGIAFTELRPSGKVEIDGEVFDAVSEYGYILKNEKIKVIRQEAGQLHVIKEG